LCEDNTSIFLAHSNVLSLGFGQIEPASLLGTQRLGAKSSLAIEDAQ
jgi:hypothetical protein